MLNITCFTEGASYPSAHERVHDLLEASPADCASASPESGQPDRKQDPWRVVVFAQARGEAEI